MFFFAASTVLKQMAEDQISIPTHFGGLAGSRIDCLILSSPTGA